MRKISNSIWFQIYPALCFLHLIGSIGVRSLIGWGGFLVVSGALVIGGVILFNKARQTKQFSWHFVPHSLLLFLAFATVSIIWSAYRVESLLGITAQLATSTVAVLLAFLFSWQQLVRALATSLRYILMLSLLFELYVAAILRKPLLQGFVTVNDATNPSELLYWSRALLFSGGPIQGVIANSALLGLFALIALVVFAAQLLDGETSRCSGWFWISTAALVLLLTRSATVWIALLVVAATALFALWARRSAANRTPVYISGFALLAATTVAALTLYEPVSKFLGKSPDFTGRFEIWHKVAMLAQEHPVLGLGWVSHWAPWAEPFASLDTKVGLPVMHAHNAWLDVRLQLGWVGLVIFTVFVLGTVQRVWCLAVDQPRQGVTERLPYRAYTMLPLLIMAALLIQSLTESRLLIESGWLLLVLFATKTTSHYRIPLPAQKSKKLMPYATSVSH
ncbi:O-antigen ligase family protein [Canibacter sp. lx-72]|uniref:O-antigen ligase family protein n=1 Tax=Canibacter zhuwentaonis TaxID=2837491 RepID=UPI001BDD8CCE|nr:O-antigen ligase family protein [Canibacter zhuwentaonis]MBT1018583.1 O-antigen ligase family protein [Canibacter zhuwentaonis]